jgi:hypothetical protein
MKNRHSRPQRSVFARCLAFDSGICIRDVAKIPRVAIWLKEFSAV